MPVKSTLKKKTTSVEKSTTTKKVVSAKPKEVSKTAAKKVEPAKKDTTTKKAAKKTTTAKKVAPTKKKTTTTKKVETKTTAKKAEPKKAAAKPAAKKVAEKKVEPKTVEAKKVETKKVESKPVEVKPTVSKVTKTKAVAAKKAPAKKATAKKAAAKKVNAKKAATKKPAQKPSVDKAKQEQYNNFALDTCFEMAQALGVNMNYDNYAALLLDSDDLDALTKKVLEDFHVDPNAFTFEKDGYDSDLIRVIFERVGQSVDIKAGDFEQIGKDVKAHAEYKIQDDSTRNNEEYQKDFDIVRKVLMIAQRKDIHQTVDLAELIKANPTAMIEKFMDLAYNVLTLFEYDDVKYYENFIYAVLSQFDDLHEKLGTRALMDVADLYIKHGDYGLGDANYNYVLRENQIKDMIYYRFANVYVDIDLDKAKAIANSAFQYVDDRYDYYPKLIEILEK